MLYDLIIRGGTVYDGTGAPGVRADVAVRDGKIAAIGDLKDARAARELDAAGLAVAPGFIDAHCHSDRSFVLDDAGDSRISQGITTEVCGQCGGSPFPALPQRLAETARAEGVHDRFFTQSFDEYVRLIQAQGQKMGTNLALLVGHGCVRGGVMGYEDRAPTDTELEEMKALLRRDLEDGAWGLSLGLEYTPGCFADARELAALGQVVRECGGIVTAHLRNEGEFLPQAIEELLAVGRATGVHVHISHLKIDNFRFHGQADKIWAQIERARTEGVNVTADVYPYTASCTWLNNRCPKWTLDGGNQAVVQHLAGPRRQEILDFIRDEYYFHGKRAETCLIHDDGGHWPEIVGKNLREIAEEMLHTQDYAWAAAEILTRTNGEAEGIFFVMSDDDMRYFLNRDTCICSDGYGYSLDPKKVPNIPHPRSYGAIAEFFRLAREEKLCSLEAAIQRVTQKPAQMAGITDRGLLQEGLAADITVFDPAVIAPRATYLDPIQPAAGVSHVVVNGAIALENGTRTAARTGGILRKNR